MLHVWFTGELRSAFAITAPQPELCADGFLPARLLSTAVAGASAEIALALRLRELTRRVPARRLSASGMSSSTPPQISTPVRAYRAIGAPRHDRAPGRVECDRVAVPS